MTSASTLFYNRRSSRRQTTRDFEISSVFDPDRSLDLNIHPNRRGNGCCSNQRRESPHFRNLCSRGGGSYPLGQECSMPRLSESTGQFVPSTSANNNSLASADRTGLSGHDRLPGDVLLARARLFQRLRGEPLLINRHVDLIHIEARSRGTEISTHRSQRRSPAFERTSLNGRLRLTPELNNRPPGLTQNELASLEIEAFSSGEILGIDASLSRGSRDCSICLEGFEDGDKLIRLKCEHRFHKGCLFPWIQTCGDCPNCRRGIAVGQ